MQESKIQSNIIKYAKSINIFVIKIGVSYPSGVPDLLLLHNSKVLFIEVKSTSGKLSHMQKYISNEIRKQDIDILIARDFNFSKEYIVKWLNK